MTISTQIIRIGLQQRMYTLRKNNNHINTIRNIVCLLFITLSQQVVVCWNPTNLLLLSSPKCRRCCTACKVSTDRTNDEIFSNEKIQYEPTRTTTTSTQRIISNNNNNDKQFQSNKSKANKSKPSFVQAVHRQKIQDNVLQKKQQQMETTTVSDLIPKDTKMKTTTISKKQKKPYNSDSYVGSMHMERVSGAGRPGTKRFVDPCKVYIGNLPFHLTEEQLQNYVCNIIGLPSYTCLNQCKIIHDWKTTRSKGYGFVVVTEAIYASILIDKCNSNVTIGTIENRRLTVGQGKSKAMEKQLYIEEQKWQQKQQMKRLKDDEDLVIQSGLNYVNDGFNDNDDNGTRKIIQKEMTVMDLEEYKMLKSFDKDLVENVIIRGQEEQFMQSLTEKTSSSTNVSPSVLSKEIEKMNTIETVSNNTLVVSDSDINSSAMDEEEDEEEEDDDDDDEYDWEAIDGAEVYDDSDEGIDGIWYGDDDDDVTTLDDDNLFVFDEKNGTKESMSSSNMEQQQQLKFNEEILNREQRRNVTAMLKKKRKLPYKGFG